MEGINAQSANCVNPRTVNKPGQTRHMGKAPTTHPSPFWSRLAAAWGRQGLPTSQNGVATKLNMSQGSTRRWFTGDGYPEIPQLVEIARLGRCSIHWLLTGIGPESMISDPETALLLKYWGELPPGARKAVLRAAQVEHFAGAHTIDIDVDEPPPEPHAHQPRR